MRNIYIGLPKKTVYSKLRRIVTYYVVYGSRTYLQLLSRGGQTVTIYNYRLDELHQQVAKWLMKFAELTSKRLV